MNPGVVAQLRDLMPDRPLTRIEALSIAERQAQRFLELTGIADGPVDDSLICDLPRIEVRRTSPWPSSGATQWIRGRWVIMLNASEPFVRQRFSLAHEFKHIIDHQHIALIYRDLPAHQRHDFAEAVCNYFAGCLLMPRPWVKRAYAKTQRLDRLARHFHVSQAAMATRLSQIGLTDPAPRCTSLYSGDWLDAGADLAGSITRYQRSTDHGPLIPELLTA